MSRGYLREAGIDIDLDLISDDEVIDPEIELINPYEASLDDEEDFEPPNRARKRGRDYWGNNSYVNIYGDRVPLNQMPYEYQYAYGVGMQNKQGRKQRFRELKYSDQSLQDGYNTVGDGGYFRREYNPMQVFGGEDNNNRLGTEITLTSLDFRAYFSLFYNPGIKVNYAGVGQNDNLTARIRLLVYIDRDGTEGDGKALGQEGGYGTFSRNKSILSDGSFWSFYNLDNAPRYEILHDECFEIKPDIKAKKWFVRGLLDDEVDTRTYASGAYPQLPTRTEMQQFAGINAELYSENIAGVKYVTLRPSATVPTTVDMVAKTQIIKFSSADLTANGVYTGPIGGTGGGTYSTVAGGPGNKRGDFQADSTAKAGLFTATSTFPSFKSIGGAPNEGPIIVENKARFTEKTVETNENSMTRQWTPDKCWVKKRIHINLNDLVSKFKDMTTTYVTTRQLRWGLIVDTQTLDVNVEYNTRIRFDD